MMKWPKQARLDHVMHQQRYVKELEEENLKLREEVRILTRQLNEKIGCQKWLHGSTCQCVQSERYECPNWRG